MSLTLALDILIAVLLAVTIAYCWVLQGKLKALRSAQSGMKKSIDAFHSAVEQAQLAIGEMSATGERMQAEGAALKKDMADSSQEAVQKLEGSLGRAKSVVTDLKLLSETADGAAETLDRMIKAAKAVENSLADQPVAPAKKKAPKPSARAAAPPQAMRSGSQTPDVVPVAPISPASANPASSRTASQAEAPIAPLTPPDPNADLMAEDEDAETDHQDMMDELGGRSEVEKDLLKALRQAK